MALPPGVGTGSAGTTGLTIVREVEAAHSADAPQQLLQGLCPRCPQLWG